MSFLERVTYDLLGDIAFYRSALRSLRRTAPIARHPGRILPFVVDELAQRFRDAPALLSARETFSYRTLAERTNKYARWALNQNLTKGNVVCLLMPNRPDYLAIWLGVTKVGGIAALLNTNLTGASLAHCIDAVAPKHIIVSAALLDAWETARRGLHPGRRSGCTAPTVTPMRRIDREIEKLSGDPPAGCRRALPGQHR